MVHTLKKHRACIVKAENEFEDFTLPLGHQGSTLADPAGCSPDADQSYEQTVNWMTRDP